MFPVGPRSLTVPVGPKTLTRPPSHSDHLDHSVARSRGSPAAQRHPVKPRSTPATGLVITVFNFCRQGSRICTRYCGSTLEPPRLPRQSLPRVTRSTRARQVARHRSRSATQAPIVGARRAERRKPQRPQESSQIPGAPRVIWHPAGGEGNVRDLFIFNGPNRES
jgi:hypothetical protein